MSSLSQLPEPMRTLLSTHPEGQRIEAIMRIAEGPAPEEGTKDYVRYFEAVELNKLYFEAAVLPRWRIMFRLPGLFNKTNKFHKDHPSAMGQQGR